MIDIIIGIVEFNTLLSLFFTIISENISLQAYILPNKPLKNIFGINNRFKFFGAAKMENKELCNITDIE